MKAAFVLGALSLVLAWVSGFITGGGFLGLPEGFFYTNAINLQILAISAGIATLVLRRAPQM